MKKFSKNLGYGALAGIVLVLSAFCTSVLLEDKALYLQTKLTEHYDISQEGPDVSGYELQVTNTGFCRYKRVFTNGKIEYFSFNVLKYKAFDYSGTPKNGRLFLRTLNDDVIVQTHHDRKGDVDSMATYLAIPLKDIQEADLKDLAERFHLLSIALAAR